MKTAVIGAGMAGLTVAGTLRKAGYQVTVFDKSKGTGGRLASRSYPGGWIDHGAPYFSAEPGFSDFLRQQLPAGILQAWRPQVAGQLRSDEQSDLIGVPRNSAITRGLLGELRFQPSTRIARLEAGADGWQLYNDGGSRLGDWALVVVAVPAPQALMLVANQPLFAEQLERVRMEPAWVAAIRTGQSVDRWPGVAVFDHPVLRRIVNNSAKPGRGAFSRSRRKPLAGIYWRISPNWPVASRDTNSFLRTAGATRLLKCHSAAPFSGTGSYNSGCAATGASVAGLKMPGAVALSWRSASWNTIQRSGNDAGTSRDHPSGLLGGRSKSWLKLLSLGVVTPGWRA